VFEVGGIGALDLQDVHAFVVSKAVAFADKGVDGVKIFDCVALWPVFGIAGDETDYLIFVFRQ